MEKEILFQITRLDADFQPKHNLKACSVVISVNTRHKWESIRSNRFPSNSFHIMWIKSDLSVQERGPLMMALWWVDLTRVKEVFCWLRETDRCWVGRETSSLDEECPKKSKKSSNLNPKSRKTIKNLETTIQTRKWGQRKGAIKNDDFSSLCSQRQIQYNKLQLFPKKNIVNLEFSNFITTFKFTKRRFIIHYLPIWLPFRNGRKYSKGFDRNQNKHQRIQRNNFARWKGNQKDRLPNNQAYSRTQIKIVILIQFLLSRNNLFSIIHG